jgi:hypothetical protein
MTSVVETKKPQIKYEDGKLIVNAEVGVDTDHDGKNAVGLKAELHIDAMEAVGEIVKNEVPEWLKALINKQA